MDTEQRFCEIINRYCDSLAVFIETIKRPTEVAIEKIRAKFIKTKKFDKYVVFIENFNNITNSIAGTIKIIIFSLNKLFIDRNVNTLINFISSIQKFLDFLVDKDIFFQLNELKICFDTRYDTKIKFLEKLDKIRTIIFKIFNMSVSISAIFIPGLSTITIALTEIENQIIIQINDSKEKNDREWIDVDAIIKSLLNAELRSEFITKIKIDSIYECIHDKQSDELLPVIENLQNEYISIIMISIALKSEIFLYKKKKPVFTAILNFCKTPTS